MVDLQEVYGNLKREQFSTLTHISHTFSSRSGGRAGLSALRHARPRGPRKRTVQYVEEADGGGTRLRVGGGTRLRVAQSGRIIAPVQ